MKRSRVTVLDEGVNNDVRIIRRKKKKRRRPMSSIVQGLRQGNFGVIVPTNQGSGSDESNPSDVSSDRSDGAMNPFGFNVGFGGYGSEAMEVNESQAEAEGQNANRAEAPSGPTKTLVGLESEMRIERLTMGAQPQSECWGCTTLEEAKKTEIPIEEVWKIVQLIENDLFTADTILLSEEIHRLYCKMKERADLKFGNSEKNPCPEWRLSTIIKHLREHVIFDNRVRVAKRLKQVGESIDTLFKTSLYILDEQTGQVEPNKNTVQCIKVLRSMEKEMANVAEKYVKQDSGIAYNTSRGNGPVVMHSKRLVSRFKRGPRFRR